MSIHSREVASSVLNRITRICGTIAAMDADTCREAIEALSHRFDGRHRDLEAIFRERFRQLKTMTGLAAVDDAHAVLIGAYFSHEYSFQAAAVLNPSAVRHPDQSGLKSGAVRFILSTRCVGEGHISTIAFREGIFHADGEVELKPAPKIALAALPEASSPEDGPVTLSRAAGAALDETVIFPVTRAQMNGLEDLRLTEFSDGAEHKYIGTYTAFSGRELRCERFETTDFHTFRLSPMRGEATLHKALAFFPRKINGRYAAIGRLDHESLFYLESDDLGVWDQGERIMTPKAAWELMQVGNCGSPIELDEGWLVVTHGVGPVRQYALGAVLLDKRDPRKVLARSATPLLEPDTNARDGYAPNAIYSCGALRAGNRLFLPYAVADTCVNFASLDIPDILNSLASA